MIFAAHYSFMTNKNDSIRPEFIHNPLVYRLNINSSPSILKKHASVSQMELLDRLFSAQPNNALRMMYTIAIMGFFILLHTCLSHPQIFPYLGVFAWIIAMISRLFDYWSRNEELYLIDFCYFVDILSFCAAFFFSDATLSEICDNSSFRSIPYALELIKVIFACAAGPVTVAIVFWKNALVFHSPQRIVSILIHCLPFLMVGRMSINVGNIERAEEVSHISNIVLNYKIMIPGVAIVYICWQLLYMFLIFGIFHFYRKKHPYVHCSLGDLCSKFADPKSSIWLLRAIARHNPVGAFSCLAMLIVQGGYTILTSLLTPILWEFPSLFIAVEIFAAAYFLWNGAKDYYQDSTGFLVQEAREYLVSNEVSQSKEIEQ
ncbi:Glycerophosphocholine acyltransferase 1 like protein [Aduncisulcus paluster]|uniref:Glycerophosphocholine acyltransferase 1 n=1 Tax=Aduncisulcus paluster TaxID=2918883 RepID=A0ABQ5KI64_9EUKA|nr:Glycerophosphocholine acyltransferase 1 like protein [Aduncisulcus paluster]